MLSRMQSGNHCLVLVGTAAIMWISSVVNPEEWVFRSASSQRTSNHDHERDRPTFWLDKLNQFIGNFVEAEMVKAFISSIEYRQRFGP